MRERSRRRRAGILLLAAGALLAAASGAARAEEALFTGRVTDASGKALPEAMITLEAAEMVPATLTVFSDETGAYAMPAPEREVPAEKQSLTCTKVGYEPARRSGPAGEESRVDFALEPTENVAGEVPASAWLQDLPDTQARYRTVLVCAACHQFPLEVHQATAQSFRGLTLEEREEAWHAVFARMRMPHTFGDTFPEGSAAANLPPEVVEQLAYNIMTREDEEAIAPLLAEHFPVRFDEFPRSELRTGAPLGVGRATVVEEYQLPRDSHVREVTFTRGSPYLWGVDLRKNRMLRLDLTDGAQKWFSFPAQGPTGPHTIAGDAGGNVWVSAQENDTVAKFDPEENRWTRVYRFSPGSVVHDIALDSRAEVAFDPSGNVWLTLMNKNMLGRLDAETGETAEFALPVPEGADPNRAPYTTAAYGAVMTSDGRTVWFSQLNGYLGAFDTRKLEVVETISFARGTGPRRLAIDDHDVLYVPLTGAGRLFVYDARERKAIGTYDLPDRNSHPYVAAWDRQREVVWIGTSNANAIYRFDPDTEQFLEYPLPREGAYLRKLTVHPTTGNLWTSYGHFPALKGPDNAVVLRPGGTDPAVQGPLASLKELWRGLFE